MPDTAKLLSQFYVTLDGNEPPAALINDLEEIRVENSLHLPDVATLVIHDPRLRWVDDDRLLAPGKSLVITAKAGRGTRPLFDGEIVEIEPVFEATTHRLVVRAFDRLHRLARGRSVRSFQQMTDGELVQKLAREVGLQAQVGPTPQVYPYVLQANQTNLAFLQERAAALGYLLYVQGMTLHCEAPQPARAPIVLQWGEGLSEFRPRMTTIGQVSRVTARGWDPTTKQEIVREAEHGQGAPKLSDARSGSEIAQRAFRVDARYLVADRPIRTQSAAGQLAQALADKSAQRFVEAEAICGGNPTLIAGAAVELRAVGKRFGGTYFVTSATHIYTAIEGYSTQFTVSGLHPTTLLSALLPDPDDRPVTGLVIGVVTDNQDPEGMGRIKVKYPWLSSEHASDWARVVAVGGGATRGIAFLPEIDDEVLVGFELGDIHHPYVLGGLWNGVDALPDRLETLVQQGRVEQRIIRSRSGHVIRFDDRTEGGITIEDSSGNLIRLDSANNNITIEAKGDVKVNSSGTLALTASGDMNLAAEGNVNINGTRINLNC